MFKSYLFILGPVLIIILKSINMLITKLTIKKIRLI